MTDYKQGILYQKRRNLLPGKTGLWSIGDMSDAIRSGTGNSSG